MNELKQEFETLTNKLKELTDEELKEVAGGSWVEKEEFKESGATIVHRKCF
ncbi:MAG: bacteriocin [Clostridia bacterium]|nr:bacteriocin [Clostridia bacterium]